MAVLVVLTGDLFDFDPVYVEEGCRELGGLEGRVGTYAVLGNHDVYTGSEVVVEGLRSLTPIRVLRSAPLGDPTSYELRGMRLCLRRGEARQIWVVPRPDDEAPQASG